MPNRGCRLTPVIAVLALAGCATYQPPQLTSAHPAHPDAPVARELATSTTLAYTPADVHSVRASASAASTDGDHRAPGGAAKTVVGEGEVVGTTPASGQIVIEHGEIAGFMEAMTMGYRTEPPSLLATVKPGDKIRFTIDVARRAILHIEPLK
jgi:Cu(I)/Ag(I) efflux system periplasmic protein CusF